MSKKIRARRDDGYIIGAVSHSDAEICALYRCKCIAKIATESEVNFTSYAGIEELIVAVNSEYYNDGNTAPQVVGKKLNEVRRFKEMRTGNYIVIPYRGAIRLARLGEGGEDHKSSLTLDLCNQRSADYLKSGQDYLSVPRSNRKSRSATSSASARGTTIADLSEFETEINRLFNDPNASWLSQFTKVESKRIVSWGDQLLKNIRNGRTNLEAGGRGLEKLIKCLLELEGIKHRFSQHVDSKILVMPISKQIDQIFLVSDDFVQVKHHSGQSDAWGAQQLMKIRRDRKGGL